MIEAVLAQSPEQPSILNLAALCARSLGMPEKAERYWRSAIEIDPDYINAHVNLGLALQDAGRSGEAEAAFRKALELDPNDPDAMISLGNLYRATKRHTQAEASYKQALGMAPANVNALYNLGLLLADLDRLDEAEAAFRQCLKIEPNQADVYNDLGNTLMDRLRFEEAEQAYRRAVALAPGFADAYCNLGMLLSDMGRQEAALAAFRRTLELAPQHADALNGLARHLGQQGRYDEAELAYREALTVRPHCADLHNNYGNLLRELHRFAEAEAAYRKALSIQPDYGHALGQAVSCARNSYDWSNAEADVKAIVRALDEGITGIPALMMLSIPELDPVRHRIASELTGRKALQAYLNAPPLVAPERHRSHERLRIGYLSSEFHTHPVIYLLAGVLESHDRDRIEVHAYSAGPAVHDAYRKRVEKGCEFFRDISSLSMIDAARRIADDEIDILIDLSGHAGYSRPGITALRPAPVIVNWLGYPGTMGVARLADYIIGDAILTPLEHAKYYSETLAWMPHCYQPNDSGLEAAARPTRRETGLPEEAVVFCSFNQAYKLTPDMFTLWCKLLDAVPGSVLWLQQPKEDSATKNLFREAANRGIAAERLVFGPVMPMAQHLARLGLADLALDPFPYGSGATGSNVLRAGVPMVTLIGESYVSRMAASQLHAVGLPELVTTRADDYFELARDLALDPARLRALRAKLGANLSTSPLFDTQGFTRDLECLYQKIWLDHERGIRAPITDW